MTGPSLPKSNPFLLDDEYRLVTQFIQAFGDGISYTNRIGLISFYVGLKAKPLAILTSPEPNGKPEVVRRLSRILKGSDSPQLQLMQGHPWWADGDENIAFFTDVACQLRHSQLTHIGDTRFSKPVSFPLNLFMIGTMDIRRFVWWDNDLLSYANVIPWRDQHLHDGFLLISESSPRLIQGKFLGFCVRSERSARKKLCSILGWGLNGLRPLRQVEDIIEGCGHHLPSSAMGESLIFLANSWSKKGVGLFDISTSGNLAISLDLAIQQNLLSRVTEQIRESKNLRQSLGKFLMDKYPRSMKFLRLQCEL